MSSPPPLDPYLALGISKDADLSTIRSAHRKLVLRFHPDRIKDEGERIRGREEFQKVQQAYELLSDTAKRSRYDDKARLAELRKEAMGRDGPVRAASYPSRAPQFSTAREFRDGLYYEERVPMGAAFFDEEDRYQEEPVRASARKGDSYERKMSATYMEKMSAGRKTEGISINITSNMRKKAASAKERVKERDLRAAHARTRDQERRREASDKHSRSAYVQDPSSDSDTATYNRVNQKAAKASPVSSMPRRSRAESRRKVTRDSDDEDDWRGDKHQVLHASAYEYIQKAKERPRQLHRQDSSHSYFEPRDDRSHPRRSDSDRDDRRTEDRNDRRAEDRNDRRAENRNDRRTEDRDDRRTEDRDDRRTEDRRRELERAKSSRPRRPSYSEAEILQRPRNMPPMPTANSAPPNIKIPDIRGDVAQPHRAFTAQAARDNRKEAPPVILRSNTMPSVGTARRSERVSTRGSSLKHTETQDSGYGSSSPATPDMGGTSPPRFAQGASIRYQIVEEAEEYRGLHAIPVGREDPNPRTRSFSKEPKRPTLSTSGPRSKPSRAETAYTPRSPADVQSTRPRTSRRESFGASAQAREPPVLSRGGSNPRDRKQLFREVQPNEQEHYNHRGAHEKIASPRSRPQESDFGHYPHHVSRDVERDEDHYPGSRYRAELRNPTRRPSDVY